MNKRDSTGASRHSPARNAAKIPSIPTYRFNGQAQPASFSAGVEAFRRFIVETEAGHERIDDRAFAEKHARTLLDAMSAQGPFSLGFAAALANWLAIARHSSQPAESWTPLYTPPAHRIVNDGDYYEPPPRSLLFELDGEPVCVTEELTCYRFDDSDVTEIALAAVRQRGKAVTRERFEELRVEKHS